MAKKKFKRKLLYENVAKSLNEKGILPDRARQFSYHTIQMFISMGKKDQIITKEIEDEEQRLCKLYH
jgi:hypothetical protein